MECYIHFLPMFSEKKKSKLSIFVTFLYCTPIYPPNSQPVQGFFKEANQGRNINMLFHKQDHSIITESYVLQGWGATSTATWG